MKKITLAMLLVLLLSGCGGYVGPAGFWFGSNTTQVTGYLV